MATEYALKYRPTRFADVWGQDLVCKELTKRIEEGNVPRAMIFHGHSGCGKTTVARIVAMNVGCDLGSQDFIELNAASTRGINTVREIEDICRTRPLFAKKRVIIIDESHQLTGEAKSSLLKVLEEVPDHTHIILCTTELESHPQTVKTRCTKFEFKSLPDSELELLIEQILKKEKVQVSKKVIDRIVSCCGGSAREALNMLNKVTSLDNEQDQLDSIVPEEVEATAIDLARLLINKQPKWVEAANLLKKLDYDPEKVRLIILGYAATVAINNPKKKNRAYLVLLAFENNFWQSKKSGLVRACLEVCQDATTNSD